MTQGLLRSGKERDPMIGTEVAEQDTMPALIDPEASAALREVAAAAVKLMELLPGEAPPPGGSLTVVGTGIRAMTQLTVEALAAMTSAEVLVHVIGEPVQEQALLEIN